MTASDGDGVRKRLSAAIYSADDGKSSARWDHMADAAIAVLRGPEATLREQIESVLRASHFGLTDDDVQLALAVLFALPSLQQLAKRAGE